MILQLSQKTMGLRRSSPWRSAQRFCQAPKVALLGMARLCANEEAPQVEGDFPSWSVTLKALQSAGRTLATPPQVSWRGIELVLLRKLHLVGGVEGSQIGHLC